MPKFIRPNSPRDEAMMRGSIGGPFLRGGDFALAFPADAGKPADVAIGIRAGEAERLGLAGAASVWLIILTTRDGSMTTPVPRLRPSNFSQRSIAPTRKISGRR